MDPQTVFCPNPACPTSGQMGYRIGIHSRQKRQYMCHECKKPFVETAGTLFYGKHYQAPFISQMVSLMAHGCPLSAIVNTFHIDERTLQQWRDEAGAHCEQVHQALVHQQALDLQHVQVDEMRVKLQGQVVWMALALMVGTHLWLGGVISAQRDKHLLRAIGQQIKACALCRPLLIVFDGLGGYLNAMQFVFREPLRLGRLGAPRKVPWPELALGQVHKERAAQRVVGMRTHLVQGATARVGPLLAATQGTHCLNTAFIERLNATFRQRCAALARRSRCLLRSPEALHQQMYLVGTVYNFCTVHQRLRVKLHLPHGYRWVQRTPAMAAGLTDHPWTIYELLSYQLPPPRQPIAQTPPTTQRRPRLRTMVQAPPRAPAALPLAA